MDNPYKFQDIINWEANQLHKSQKEDIIFNFYREQLYTYGEIDPNSFSLKYENGESIAEFNIEIPKDKFEDDFDKKNVKTEIIHRVGGNYTTEEGHWQLSYADVIDKGNTWFIEVMVKSGVRPVNEQKEIKIDNWERNYELKLQIEDDEIIRTIKDLGIYGRYIDENSIKTRIDYEDNTLELDIYIPVNLVSNFDKKDVEYEIRNFLGNYDQGIGGTFRKSVVNAMLVTTNREASYKSPKQYWKVHIINHWGIN